MQLLVLDLENLAVTSLKQLHPLLEMFRGRRLRSLNELYLLGSVKTPSLTLPIATSPRYPTGTAQPTRKLFHCVLHNAAARASALRVLRCQLEYLVPNVAFPVMRHLEYLVLSVACGAVLPELAVALPTMQKLQTVHLYNPLQRHAGWSMPSLNLMWCIDLQTISSPPIEQWTIRLGGIAPADLHLKGLKLPSSCTVHLDLTSWELACAPVWSTLRSVGFLFCDQISRAMPKGPGGPVSWLNGPVQLDTVCTENITKETAAEMPAAIAGAQAEQLSTL